MLPKQGLFHHVSSICNTQELHIGMQILQLGHSDSCGQFHLVIPFCPNFSIIMVDETALHLNLRLNLRPKCRVAWRRVCILYIIHIYIIDKTYMRYTNIYINNSRYIYIYIYIYTKRSMRCINMRYIHRK